MEQELVISKEILDQAGLTPEELAIELAVHLYAQKRLTVGQARHLAGSDQLAFQRELVRRAVHIHYDWADVETDLKNLGIEL